MLRFKPIGLILCFRQLVSPANSKITAADIIHRDKMNCMIDGEFLVLSPMDRHRLKVL